MEEYDVISIFVILEFELSKTIDVAVSGFDVDLVSTFSIFEETLLHSSINDYNILFGFIF